MGLGIGFYPTGGRTWYAGIVTFKALLDGIRLTFGETVRCYLMRVADQPTAGSDERFVVGESIAIQPVPDRDSETKADWQAAQPHNHGLPEDVALRKYNIDLIFGRAGSCEFSKARKLIWLTDFQHKYTPDIYTPEGCRARDRTLRDSAQAAARIVVKSQAVAGDVELFLPQYLPKTRVIRFVSAIPPSVYQLELQPVLNTYSLPDRFIYLPNQFWKHKNHETVFRAIKLLKETGERVSLVCSGFAHDFRHPAHAEALLRKRADWGIEDQIIYVGMIPHEHVLQLMRQSVCVLNPSLFEGFGNTASEAKSLGKRVLLSDIPAHREHDPPKGVFFDPGNVADLAAKIAEVWRHVPPGPDLDLEQQARAELPGRISRFAESFVTVAREVAHDG
jgi:glycosyltransferase involved in cell wall biosynthesis